VKSQNGDFIGGPVYEHGDCEYRSAQEYASKSERTSEREHENEYGEVDTSDHDKRKHCYASESEHDQQSELQAIWWLEEREREHNSEYNEGETQREREAIEWLEECEHEHDLSDDKQDCSEHDESKYDKSYRDEGGYGIDHYASEPGETSTSELDEYEYDSFDEYYALYE